MPAWSLSAVLGGVLIAVHYLTLRAASGRLGDALAALLLEGAAMLGASGPTTTAGAVWSCASGLCISGAMTLLFLSLRQGGPVSATGPIVLGVG